MDSTFWLMLLAIVLGSAISLIGGATIFLSSRRRELAITLALPFGAGALLGAAFFDLLPEAMTLGNARHLLEWTLLGFIIFFLLERSSSWFHHHHEHAPVTARESQNILVMIGDLLHNIIDGIAIGAAFLVNPVTGFVTTLAVSAHEIPKELGTFGILLSRGWKDRRVLLANILTAVGTLIAASLTYGFGSSFPLPEAELLALTAGFFIYVAASDIVPDIHEQTRPIGTLQAAVLVLGVVFVWTVITLLGV
ncbi:MAG TPA: ZIP family metal transporter [Patescibacteria group bacterium]|jgi:zinc and cadmium transporter|nr:ZIP family metal transporter [Patescibacteria group bacterium]